jgi:hypothetical protein
VGLTLHHVFFPVVLAFIAAALSALLLVGGIWMLAAPALAQETAKEPVGCDKFKWPLDKERATLTGTDLPKIESGTQVAFPVPFGAIVALKPLADAKLPTPPEVAPKSPDSFAGFFAVRAPGRAGTYKITIAAPAWIDVVQADKAVKSGDFSGALGCEGARKSVKFDLAAKPFTVELSGVGADSIKLAISPD